MKIWEGVQIDILKNEMFLSISQRTSEKLQVSSTINLYITTQIIIVAGDASTKLANLESNLQNVQIICS